MSIIYLTTDPGRDLNILVARIAKMFNCLKELHITPYYGNLAQSTVLRTQYDMATGVNDWRLYNVDHGMAYDLVLTELLALDCR